MGDLTGVIAIVCLFGWPFALIGFFCWRGLLTHLEEKERIRAGAVGAGADFLRSEIEALRREVGGLRDTTTQYDVSIQHTLDQLQHRVATLEAAQRNGASMRQMIEDEPAILQTRQA